MCADRCGTVPIPGVAMLYFFASFFTRLIRSGSDFAGTLGCEKNTWGEADRFEIGMKLL
jgi:hypothetical protein